MSCTSKSNNISLNKNCSSDSQYFKVNNLFSELNTNAEKKKARLNLGIADEQSLTWGNITGNVADQTDLVNLIDSKILNPVTIRLEDLEKISIGVIIFGVSPEINLQSQTIPEGWSQNIPSEYTKLYTSFATKIGNTFKVNDEGNIWSYPKKFTIPISGNQYAIYNDSINQVDTPTSDWEQEGWHINSTDTSVWVSFKYDTDINGEVLWGTPIRIHFKTLTEENVNTIVGNALHNAGITDGSVFSALNNKIEESLSNYNTLSTKLATINQVNIDENGNIVIKDSNGNTSVWNQIDTEDYLILGNTYGNINDTFFTVSKEGLLTANNAVIYGTVYATNGYFMGDVHANNLTLSDTAKTTLNNEFNNYITSYDANIQRDLQNLTNEWRQNRSELDNDITILRNSIQADAAKFSSIYSSIREQNNKIAACESNITQASNNITLAVGRIEQDLTKNYATKTDLAEIIVDPDKINLEVQTQVSRQLEGMDYVTSQNLPTKLASLGITANEIKATVKTELGNDFTESGMTIGEDFVKFNANHFKVYTVNNNNQEQQLLYLNDNGNLTLTGEINAIAGHIGPWNITENGIEWDTETWNSLKGEKGDKGDDGRDGTDGVDGRDADIWTIGDDKYWYKNGQKTGYLAVGKDGRDGVDGAARRANVQYSVNKDNWHSDYDPNDYFMRIGVENEQGEVVYGDPIKIKGEDAREAQFYFGNSASYLSDGSNPWPSDLGECDDNSINTKWFDTPHLKSQSNPYVWMCCITPVKLADNKAYVCLTGEKGQNGTTLYTWIKYADDSTGSGLSDSPINSDGTFKAYIGFAYNKTTAIESENASDYTWTQYKGTDGTNGIDGTDGIDGTTYYTWIKYSDVASPTSSQIYDNPRESTEYIGIAVNQISSTESTDPNKYTWSKFKGDQGVAGNDGQDGISLVSSYPIYYYTNQSSTPTAPTELKNINKVLIYDGWTSVTASELDANHKYIYTCQLNFLSNQTIQCGLVHRDVLMEMNIGHTGALATAIRKYGITTDTLYSCNILGVPEGSTNADGSLKEDYDPENSIWALKADGTGWLANKGIQWDLNGNIETVKLSYQQQSSIGSFYLKALTTDEFSKLTIDDYINGTFVEGFSYMNGISGIYPLRTETNIGGIGFSFQDFGMHTDNKVILSNGVLSNKEYGGSHRDYTISLIMKSQYGVGHYGHPDIKYSSEWYQPLTFDLKNYAINVQGPIISDSYIKTSYVRNTEASKDNPISLDEIANIGIQATSTGIELDLSDIEEKVQGVLSKESDTYKVDLAILNLLLIRALAKYIQSSEFAPSTSNPLQTELNTKHLESVSAPDSLILTKDKLDELLKQETEYQTPKQ